MYHDVSDDPDASGFQRVGARPYRIPERLFARHLDALASAGAAPELVTGVDLIAPGRHLFLTFDDGGRSALRVADLLGRRGWSGHFFVVTSLIGARTFLTAGEIRYLRTCGHVVGSHSHTHPDIFRELAGPRMRDEWRVSRAILADILGEPCVAASVPGGDSSARVFASAAHAGLRYLFTSEPRILPRHCGACWVVGRATLRAASSAETAARLARFSGWSRERAIWWLKGGARRALAPVYREYVRASTRPGTDGGDALGSLMRSAARVLRRGGGAEIARPAPTPGGGRHRDG